MQLGVIGTNFQLSSLEFRESLRIPDADQATWLQTMIKKAAIAECVCLNTCNRIELYIAAPDIETSLDRVNTLWSTQPLHRLTQQASVHHLFSVASGLASLVIGESEILGQVKQAYHTAQVNQTTGPYLNKLMQSSIAIGKKVRDETGIATGVYSVSSIAVNQLRDNNLEFFGQRILIIGAGVMARRALKKLIAIGHNRVVVTNRTPQTGEALAASVNCPFVPLAEALSTLTAYDCLLVATASPVPLITKDQLPPNTAMTIIDLGMPRNVEPDIQHYPNITSTVVDDLVTIANRNVAVRHQAYDAVKSLIQDQEQAYWDWFNYRSALQAHA